MRTILLLAAAGATLVHLSCDKSRAATNKAPIIQALTTTPAGPILAPDTLVSLLLAFTDPDETNPQPASYSFTWSVVAVGFDPPAGLTDSLIVRNANPATWRTPDTPGTYRIRGEVCDRFDDCSSTDITLTVEIANRPPRITASSVDRFSPFIDELVTITVAAEDPDGDALVWEWTATRGSFVSRGPGEATWVGTQVGPAVITVKVLDPDGASDTEQFTLDVR